jgi:segregation and condensation protein A
VSEPQSASSPASSEWRVELPQFSGPLELLLHLLDEEELDVEGIAVARVCDRYLDYLHRLEKIDIDAAGEFLVMASTLMRIKSQSLLPEEERILEDDDLDPRFELVRQLIEYRKYKRAAEKLGERREAYQWRFERGMRPELRERPEHHHHEAVDAGGATLEQLFAAFARLLEETQEQGGWVIARDDTPMAEHIARLESAFTPGRRLTLSELVGERRTRGWIVGVFLALLETLRRGLVRAEQEGDFGEVRLVVPDAPTNEERPRPR